jgi:copper chaperone NosL
VAAARREPDGGLVTSDRLAAALMTLAVAAACGHTGPRPIVFGSEPCAHCHMTIVDRRYAAELVTTTGKAYAFDDVGCMAAFLAAGTVEPGRVAGAYFHVYLEPDRVYPAAEVRLVHSDTLRTPMGSGLAAAHAGSQVASLQQLIGGTVETWDEARERAAQ